MYELETHRSQGLFNTRITRGEFLRLMRYGVISTFVPALLTSCNPEVNSSNSVPFMVPVSFDQDIRKKMHPIAKYLSNERAINIQVHQSKNNGFVGYAYYFFGQ